MSKCRFGCDEVDYLGHLVSMNGVRVNPAKLKAIVDRLIPNSVKALRGFLDLNGYYRKFIHGYESIDAPLIALLKKNGFCWNDEAQEAFQRLKQLIELKQIYANDSELHELLKKVNKGPSSSWFSIKREFLFYKGGLYVPKDLQIINKFMHLLHSSLEGGHSGVDKTLYRLKPKLGSSIVVLPQLPPVDSEGLLKSKTFKIL
ncbi:uncharacterized protein LOC122276828 [Carya illinoinensis]|uniref:uncharacterized protein LOC122276828 n=1 Tax=Carya illinoinensis TaxID=32201 RepID=UPI001C71FE40|nr:uncharacterized protein LOC122276828 [Carya illinoinensis]